MSLNQNCGICKSSNFVKINTYKHIALVCNDCNCVSHYKKQKYLLEYLFPRIIAKKMLPQKAFLRLFSDRNDYNAADFYNTEAFDSTESTGWRASEVRQVLDQLKLIGLDPMDKIILDISGGPGYVGRALNNQGADVTVTEFSESAVKSMVEKNGIKSVKFDYNVDKITDVVNGKFDLIMIRSSIIFCPNLYVFVDGLRKILSDNGVIMIESILPSMGEIFWWQQLEYKFPYIYSQETIEKIFSSCGFYLELGYKDTGSYFGVKYRSYNSISRHFFTWFVEFPMLVAYHLISKLKRPAIDSKLNHKMITQFWRNKNCLETTYKEYIQGELNKSKTFGYEYNGYLTK